MIFICPSRAGASGRRRSATWPAFVRKRAFTGWSTRFCCCTSGPGWSRCGCEPPVGWGPATKPSSRSSSSVCKRPGLADRFGYDGVVERAEKLELLRSINVLSVPTEYHEPKGIFVLEAWAAGLPVVQPAHGAFPEMLAATGGGRVGQAERCRGAGQRAGRAFAGSLGRHKHGPARPQRGRADVLRRRDGGANARRLSPHCPRPDFRQAARDGRTRGNGERATDVTSQEIGDARDGRIVRGARPLVVPPTVQAEAARRGLSRPPRIGAGAGARARIHREAAGPGPARSRRPTDADGRPSDLRCAARHCGLLPQMSASAGTAFPAIGHSRGAKSIMF